MNQGCPGEGKDNRTLGWLICPLQRLMSWKSDKLPRLLIITGATSSSPFLPHPPVMAAASVWPPYLVVNVRIAQDPHDVFNSLWRLFRIGWRYDKNWKGYIGPSAAWKKVLWPLTYY